MGTIESTGRLSETKRRLLNALLNRDNSVRRVNSDKITRRNASAFAPLSYAQEEIWRRALEGINKPPFYNESITIHRRGPLNVGALQQSLTEIVRRHEIWRTTFEILDGRTMQIVHPPPEEFSVATYDLSNLPESRREEAAVRLASQQARKPFDLKTGPLLRVRVIHLNDTLHRVCVTAHQIIVDGVSVFRVFPFELVQLYEAFAKGQPSPLREPGIQYRDFAVWQRESLRLDILEGQLKYWRQQLAGGPLGLLSPGGRRTFPQTCRGSIIPGEWPKALAEKLHEVCREESVSLFMVLLAGFVVMWHQYTKQDDVIVGTLAPAGREQPEVQELLGCFLNPVPLRFRITESMTFRDLLHQAREVISGAVANDDVPFYRIAEQVSESADPGASSLFDAVISLSPDVPDLGHGWHQTFMDVESGGSTWNLYLELNERADGLVFRAQYNPDLFDAGTISSMNGDLQLILEGAAADRRKPVSEFHRK